MLLSYLEKEKRIDETQVRAIKDQQKVTGKTSDAQTLLTLGFVGEDELAKTMAKVSGLEYLTIPDVQDGYLDKTFEFIDEFKTLIPVDTARSYLIFPLALKNNILHLAVFDPFDTTVEMGLEERIGTGIKHYVLTQRHINKLVDRYYYGGLDLNIILNRVEAGDETGIPQLVSAILEDSYRQNCTDIHFCPEENGVWLRYRIDGVLHEQAFLRKSIHEPLCSRIKIMSKLDIAETRAPQDGHLQIELPEKTVDVRVSFLSTIHGENIVLRLLDTGSGGIELNDLGFLTKDQDTFKRSIVEPQGMILITGPTGSGKTTTLFSAIRILNKLERNIMTLEDPVEIRLPIVRQTQINPKANVTFASGLRSILRQDPDIILVGEIRDHETMELGVRAALTGHLVFSTLHTNNAPETIYRMIDLGLQPTLLTSVLLCVIAQRLVRKLCISCRLQVDRNSEFYGKYQKACDKSELDDIMDASIYEANPDGCPECKSGYRGRIGLYEVLSMTPQIKETILNLQKITPDNFFRIAMAEGMNSLWLDGLHKIALGFTGYSEVRRVLGAFKV